MSDVPAPATGIPDRLTGDLLVSELVETLQNLQFRRPSRTAVAEIDSDVAKFLVDRIMGLRQRHAV